MRAHSWCAVLVLGAAAVSSSAAHAQVLRARLLDEALQSPVSSAFVTLRDSSGAVVTGAMTDSAGWVQLRAERPGRYQLRVERLGYESSDAGAVLLEAGPPTTRTLTITGRPFQLAAVSAQTDRRCRTARELGAETARLWEAIRKVLGMASWSSAGQNRYEIAESQRRLTPDLRLVSWSDSTGSILSSRSPFESQPVTDLIANGFIQQRDPHTWTWFAPDADALLAPAFIELNCFRMVRHPTDATLVGLAWEPRGRPPGPWVEGVLWVKRESHGLSHVEFGYTHLPWDVSAEHAGGEIRFQQVAGGAWIVHEWWIRSPLVNVQRTVLNGVPVTIHTVARYLERRREVLAAVDAAGRPLLVR